MSNGFIPNKVLIRSHVMHSMKKSSFSCIKVRVKLFSQAAEKANFPHFKHNNSTDAQYFDVKLSDHVVTSLC